MPYLKKAGHIIDFVVDNKHKNLVQAHPLIDRVIVSDFSGWLKKEEKKVSFSSFRKDLKSVTYDMVFDLQRNWKSSLVLFFTKAKRKIGYGKNSVREKINLLFTNEKYELEKNQNIRFFYLALFQKVFPDLIEGYSSILFHLTPKELLDIEEKKSFFSSISKKKVLVSIGSTWKNKTLSLSFLQAFLKKIEKAFPVYFFFSYGTEQEKSQCLEIASSLENAQVVEKVSLVLWQPIIREMDMVIATDSSILSLTAMTNTPSFSFFGPTSSNVFAPIHKAKALQGACLYNIEFAKQCPKLRTCASGACLKNLEAETCFSKFYPWAKKYLNPAEKFQVLN